MDPSSASAELEGDESELVTIDSPVAPQSDIYAMLHCVSILFLIINLLEGTHVMFQLSLYLPGS